MRNTETQLSAYAHLDLTKKQAEVLNALEGKMTANDIAEKLGWTINRVTGRINELRYVKHQIVSRDTTKQKNSTVALYRLRKLNESADVRPKSKEEMYLDLLKEIIILAKQSEINILIEKALKQIYSLT